MSQLGKKCQGIPTNINLYMDEGQILKQGPKKCIT